ncbi:hypothetical protein [Streptomyces sp. uw30]|uniref:hypothetical protein n=1 Tax=Streptomyces sp. uw30 TaxID=1828179 RepID=UPI001651AEE2|nr:hypothetical protein [Streptomyces sp. uw30]
MDRADRSHLAKALDAVVHSRPAADDRGAQAGQLVLGYADFTQRAQPPLTSE